MLNGHNKKARAAVHVQFSGLEAKDEREQVLEAGRRIREAQQDATAVSPSPLLLLPPDRQQERQRMQQQGAQAVLLPNQIIKPLSEYLKDRYSNEARSNTLEEEEARQQEQQQQQNRTLHNAGRALSLQRGGTHERPAGTLEHPLPNEDPAVDTVMRLNIQAAELVRYLHGRYLYHAGKAGIKLEERMLEEQYEVLPDHVSRIFTEAYEPFEPCFLGSYCCAASRLQHPKGVFPAMRYLSPGQWQEWERTGKKPQNIASTCYFCYLWLVHFIVDENIRLGNRSCPVYPMFYNPVEVPGGYNRRAIRSTVEGYTNGLTRPLRFFTPNQLVPCMRRVRKQVTDPLSGQTRLEEVEVRGYREDDSLLFLDGGQPKNTILAHQPVQPPSYTVTSFTTPPLGAVSILRDELMDPARLKQHDPRIDLRPPLTPAAAKVASETAARYPDADILHSLRLQQLSLQEALRMRVGDTLSGKV